MLLAASFFMTTIWVPNHNIKIYLKNGDMIEYYHGNIDRIESDEVDLREKTIR